MAQAKRFSFPKSKRLVSNRQFKAVLDRRLAVSDQLLLLNIAANDLGCRRLGISVGKSCGNAVVRSRLKRLLREAFRQSQDQIPAGLDYLLMISPQWLRKFNTSAEVKEAVKCLKLEQVQVSFLVLAKRAAGKIK